ncbi:hypothetical protein B5P43_22490 [Bacillus sp. SRB_336]|nr:hypothetical protein B5P43_22490 [Bacillus sp. SRB_336]
MPAGRRCRRRVGWQPSHPDEPGDIAPDSPSRGRRPFRDNWNRQVAAAPHSRFPPGPKRSVPRWSRPCRGRAPRSPAHHRRPCCHIASAPGSHTSRRAAGRSGPRGPAAPRPAARPRWRRAHRVPAALQP